MPTYQTLAVRYRPKKLEDMVGQELAVRNMQGMLKSGRTAQTILICGPKGSGKTSLARMYARYLNCQNPIKIKDWVYGEPCEKCWSCLELDKTNHHHVDVHEINAAEKRGIDDVRGWISQAEYRPKSNFRVFILDEVHAITGTAASAFLKAQEEPFPHTIWILVTTEPGRLLDTAFSRMVTLNIKNVSVEDCTELLSSVCIKESFENLGKDVLTKISEAASGFPRNSLQLLESVMNITQTLDKSKLDISKLITEVAVDVVGETSDIAVRKYLFGLYKGKFTIPMAVIQTVNNPQLFIDTVLRYHTQTLRYAASDTLIDKYFLDYYAKLEAEGLYNGRNVKKITPVEGVKPTVLTVQDLSRAMKVFFEAATQQKQYFVDPYYILVNMTCAAVASMQQPVNV